MQKYDHCGRNYSTGHLHDTVSANSRDDHTTHVCDNHGERDIERFAFGKLDYQSGRNNRVNDE
jgi:hypothetical protein